MTNLELMRIKAELLNVAAARANLEVKVEESMENIKRLQDNIVIQKAKENELAAKIAEAALV